MILAENALALPELPAAGEVRLVDTVPSAMAELLRTGGVPSSVVTVNLGGEAVPRALADRIYAQPGIERLYNVYGPSEDTTFSTWALIERESPRAPSIGRPLDGEQAWVVDRHLQPVPVGVAGELYLGGEGLSRGYLGRPELTAERFVPDPFAAAPGSRMYRVGDLVRYRADGILEFLGRMDHQVKVRGFRVEPGEVESALLTHTAMRAAAVLPRPDASGGGALVAYLETLPGAVSAGELRQHLKSRLPEYMLPSAFLFLESLPLTPNGKVDRRALAALPLEARGAKSVAAPRTPAEVLVAGIFAEVLGLERVGVEEDFFALGGHSLLAMQVASRVRSAFGVKLPVRAVFEAPTVGALAGRLERSPRSEERGAAMTPLVRISREGPPALSFAQQRLWFLDQLEPGSPLYNIPAVVELAGRLDQAALAAALGEVIRRHEALRTRFPAVAGEPVPVVAESTGFVLPLVDLQGLPGREREEEASRLAAAEARRPFDLGDPGGGPLLRAALLRSEPERHGVLLTMHHIVSDGWSVGVLVRELGALYSAFAESRPSPLPELAVQYADFAAWQRLRLSGELLESELAWWRRQLAGMPPALELPTDHPRPAVRGEQGAVTDFEVDEAGLSGLMALARRQGATLFMTLLAGFAALLQRYTGEDDLVVGTPIAGRTQVETEPLIGLFVNTLVLRVDLSGTPDFAALLERVREATLSAYAHQELPFERLIEVVSPERDLSRPPLVQVLFSLQNAPSGPLALPGLALTAMPVETGTAKFDLSCTLTETGHGLSGVLEYSRDLFASATIERLAGHFTRLLAGAVDDPQRSLSELPLLSAAERGQLAAWNDETRRERPQELLGSTLHGLFAAQVLRTPEAVALIAGEERLSYGELASRSAGLARYLRGLRGLRGLGGAGGAGGDLPAAPVGAGGGAAGDAPGGGVLRAARSRLSGGAGGLHAGGQRLRRGADDGGAGGAAAREHGAGRPARCSPRGGARGSITSRTSRRLGQSGLPDLHLGLDGASEGGGHRASQRRGADAVVAAGILGSGAVRGCWPRPRSPSTCRCSSCSRRCPGGGR